MHTKKGDANATQMYLKIQMHTLYMHTYTCAHYKHMHAKEKTFLHANMRKHASVSGPSHPPTVRHVFVPAVCSF